MLKSRGCTSVGAGPANLYIHEKRDLVLVGRSHTHRLSVPESLHRARQGDFVLAALVNSHLGLTNILDNRLRKVYLGVHITLQSEANSVERVQSACAVRRAF